MNIRLKSDKGGERVYRTDLEIKELLGTVSPSFCMAKWYNATVWLGSGQTTSCHHPLPHQADLEEIKKNPKALHNTQQKKKERAMMLKGERPAGCEYCWKVEDIGRNNISDRVYKSAIYNMPLLDGAAKLDPMESDFNLRTMEISFDRTCQFACSYCNPAFSTTWVKDIRKNGPYKGLKTDGAGHYDHEAGDAGKYDNKDDNPYEEAFFKWWESDLHKTLKELRVTGGEPLMSRGTWRLLDWFAEAYQDKEKYPDFNRQMRLAINSNLCPKDDLIDKLVEKAIHIPDLDIYTSNESTKEHAEYIRDGLDWDQWLKNIEKLWTAGRLTRFHMMCTVNALCLESLPEFLEICVDMKEKYNRDFPTFTLNILRFPSFQSAVVLPDEIRQKHKVRLENFLNKYKEHPLQHEMECNQVQRLIDYLDVVKTPHADSYEQAQLQVDFKRYYTQYDKRRGKDFCSTFPGLADWYRTIPDQYRKPLDPSIEAKRKKSIFGSI
ncbi:twitch domain-containing radical SAM protein [bacterium]|nr:twitch domain-containing radical SAM protein [bacterium]